MNRTVFFILLIAVVAGTAGFFSARHLQAERIPTRQTASRAGVGLPLPDLAGQSLNAEQEQLTAFQGRTILINFWATWCAPCRREMPDLMALRSELDPEKAEVVGVALDFPADVRAYVDELGIEYPIIIPDELEGTRLLRRLGNANGLLPFSVLVDTQGIVRDVHLGELSREQARNLIEGSL